MCVGTPRQVQKTATMEKKWEFDLSDSFTISLRDFGFEQPKSMPHSILVDLRVTLTEFQLSFSILCRKFLILCSHWAWKSLSIARPWIGNGKNGNGCKLVWGITFECIVCAVKTVRVKNVHKRECNAREPFKLFMLHFLSQNNFRLVKLFFQSVARWNAVS